MLRRWFGEPKSQQDAFEQRFGFSRRRLPPHLRRAVDSLMAESSMLSQQVADLADRLTDAQALADRDPLAPVFNRRAVTRELQRVCSYVQRYRTSAAVIFVDLDGFKALNDGFGHAVGDAALIHVARLLTRCVRDSDIVGRIGGDEFVVVLANAGAEEARRKGDQIAALIAETPLSHDGIVHRLTASVGVHAFSGQDSSATDAESLLARADEAMYAAKFAGRKRLAAG